MKCVRDNLIFGNSSQPLTSMQIEELSTKLQLEPTHYALKIYPKNESEQWQIERMSDVGFTYVC